MILFALAATVQNPAPRIDITRVSVHATAEVGVTITSGEVVRFTQKLEKTDQAKKNFQLRKNDGRTLIEFY